MPTIKRQFTGKVVSDKMDKTIVVAVNQVKTHSKYRKQYTRTEKYHVHDEKNEFHVGDRVSFVEVRPLSRSKRWAVLPRATEPKD